MIDLSQKRRERCPAELLDEVKCSEFSSERSIVTEKFGLQFLLGTKMFQNVRSLVGSLCRTTGDAISVFLYSAFIMDPRRYSVHGPQHFLSLAISRVWRATSLAPVQFRVRNLTWS